MRILIRNLIVMPDGQIMADGGQASEAPDWYEIDAEFKLVLMGWHEESDHGKEETRLDSDRRQDYPLDHPDLQ